MRAVYGCRKRTNRAAGCRKTSVGSPNLLDNATKSPPRRTQRTEEILWIDSCHPINSESRRSFSRNQRLCSSVSGTRTPRALETRPIAGSSVVPSATTSDTARSPDLPTLCRQCTAMFDPSRTSRARRSTVATNASVSCGTPRSVHRQRDEFDIVFRADCGFFLERDSFRGDVADQQGLSITKTRRTRRSFLYKRSS